MYFSFPKGKRNINEDERKRQILIYSGFNFCFKFCVTHPHIMHVGLWC